MPADDAVDLCGSSEDEDNGEAAAQPAANAASSGAEDKERAENIETRLHQVQRLLVALGPEGAACGGHVMVVWLPLALRVRPVMVM